MDPVTHTLVGTALGNGLFRRRAGPAAVPILALASNLPDIDVVVQLTGDPTAVMMRRTFGHSLLLLPLWCLALTFVVRRIWRHLTPLETFGMVAVGAGLHLFFDLINSFGVVLLWPVSAARPELAWVFIIDLTLTGLLAAPLLAALAPRLRPRLAVMSRAALAAVGVYLAVCAAAHHRAATLLAGAAEAQVDQATPGGAGSEGGEAGGEGAGDDTSGLDPDWVDVGPAESPDFTYVFPEAFGAHRWRGVTRTRDRYRIYLIDVLKGTVTLRREVITRISDPRVARARASPLGRRIETFFKAPVWTIDPHTGAVRAYDLRFVSLVLGRKPVFRFTVPAR